jgi:RNA-binding protein YlmH
MKEDEKRLIARLDELAARAGQRWESVYSLFLDLAQVEMAADAARVGGVAIQTWGGYEDAERRIAAFYPQGGEDDLLWPVTPITLSWNPKFSHIGHRDVLGALMALGYKRDVLGDIMLDRQQAICFVHASAAAYILANLERVGSTTVKVSRSDPENLALPEPDWQIKEATVASLRLDAVAAASFGLARSAIQEAAAQGLIKVNHLAQIRPDAKLKEGDVLSLRGKGRAVLSQIGTGTRKNRVHIQLKCTK